MLQDQTKGECHMKNGVSFLVCLTLSCSPEGEDITNKTFTAQAITCTDYVYTPH